MLNLIAVFLFLLFLPTQLGKHFFLDFSYLSGVRIDYLAPTLYLTDILAILLIILNFKYIKPLFKQLPFYVFLNGMLLNIFFAMSPYITLYKSAKLFEVLFLFVIFKHIFEEKKVKEKLRNISLPFLTLIALNIAAAVELLLSILQLIFKQSIQGPFYYLGERYMTLSTPDIAKASLNGIELLRGYGTFSHPNSMAGFYLLLYFLVMTSKRFEKFFFLKYTFLILSALLIFCTFAKIPIIIFFILNLWFVFKSKDKTICTYCRISRIVVMGIVSFIFLYAQGDPFSLTKRFDLIQNAATIFTQHPVFGTGLGGYLIAQNQFPIKYSYFFLQPVHNIFFLYFVEAGIILSAITFYYLIRYFRNHPRSETYYYLVLIVFATGMFDHYWLTLQQNLLLLPLAFALL